MADRTVPCLVCRRPLAAPAHGAGGSVDCPQCGTRNDLPAGVRGEDESAAAGTVCPVCGGPVSPGAPACGGCGELLGPLTDGGDDRPAPPSADVGLVALVKAASGDLRRRWGVLIGGVFAAELLWIMMFVTEMAAAVGAFAFVSDVVGDLDTGFLLFFVVWGLGVLIELPVNLTILLGLADLHLTVARRALPKGRAAGEASSFSPLWRARGRRRLLLCGGVVLAALAAYGATAAVLADEFESPLRRALGSYQALETLLIATFAVPSLAAWLLFWPLPFVIVDRPDLRHFRPLPACLRLARGRWGSHLAVGLVTAALLVAAGFSYGLLLPVLGPAAGLLLAHRYDRTAGRGDGTFELDE